MDDRYTREAARRAVSHSDDPGYGILFEHGTLELGYYQPNLVDPQGPHDRDEVYIVDQGSGVFMLGDVRRPFEAGEALFVPAGMPHRFEDFSDDFATWVMFYGPSGGEQNGR